MCSSDLEAVLEHHDVVVGVRHFAVLVRVTGLAGGQRVALGAKKQIPLRLNAKLYDALAAWAEDDFRSVNGQIEYLLTECVRQRKKNGKYISDQIDVPPELDIK